MKTQKIVSVLAVAGLALWVAGCKEETKTAVEQTKDAGANVVSDVTDKAKEMAAPASAKAQELIDAAKKLVAEGKFQEALTKLKDIGGEKLSLDQQTVVNGLKAQIEKALGAGAKTATDAAGAAAGLLPAK